MEQADLVARVKEVMRHLEESEIKRAIPPAIKQIVEKELLPLYTVEIKKLMDRGELTPTAYYETYALCLNQIYQKTHRILTAIGIQDFDVFVEGSTQAFAGWMADYTKASFKTSDPAVFLKWEENQTLNQSGAAEDRQLMWEWSLEAMKEYIPQSAEWNKKIRALIVGLRGVGRIPKDESDDSAYHILWSIVFIDFLEKTGANWLTKKGTPRRLEDVLDFGHLFYETMLPV